MKNILQNKKKNKKIILFRANLGNYDDIKKLQDNKYIKITKYLFTEKKNKTYSSRETKIISKKKIFDYLKLINLYKKKLTNTDLNRIIKIYPFNFFKNYDYIAYADSTISVIGSLNNLIGKKDEWIGLRHRFSRSILDELKACYINNKITFKEFLDFYKKKINFKEYSRFTENGFFIRKNCNLVKKVSWIWLEKYLNGPHRDQLHLVNIPEFKKVRLKLLDFDLNSKNLLLKRHSRNSTNYKLFYNRITKFFRIIVLYIFVKKNKKCL
jgi:hypothetical protein